MRACSFCTIIVAGSTFTAGAPLVTPATRYQDSNAGQNHHGNEWMPSTQPNHLQKRLFSWKGSSSTPSELDSAITMTSTSDLTKASGAPATELLAASQPSSKPSQSNLSSPRSITNLFLSGSKELPSIQKPAADNHPRELHFQPNDPPPNSETNLPFSENKSIKSQPTKSLSSEALQQPESTTPFHKKSGGNGAISSSTPGAEPSEKAPKWVEKFREFWDKIVQKIKQLFRTSKKNESEEKRLQTTGTTPDHVTSQIPTTSTSHQISEHAHTRAQPSVQNTDSEITETSQTHDSTPSSLLSFNSFQRLMAISHFVPSFVNDYLPTQWFIKLLSLLRKENPSPRAQSFLLDKHSSSASPKYLSLPNSDESSYAGQLQTVPEQTTSLAGALDKMKDFIPTTHEGQLVAAALQQINTKELAECIHQVFRTSDIQLRLFAQFVSVKTIEEILLAYGGKTGEKVEDLLVEQQIHPTILGYLTTIIKNWPPRNASQKQLHVKNASQNK
ncbi:hypothetical protein PGT21_001516 [Puccinia graminis f. sp. tritici]|uniref:Uncharacterized protein n=1 Tax=Puccinia graminis f. sp. tritici TaxID=56615 RepID=A0A5B0Q1Y8_PUCGR|nr:hypothetical protein PGT21_001516 [Puccinia graminis f. sp. tritici]KAA1127915.1 hypothetical protein PGTUg99_010506 [Puccinia graminis f. sp. tritici]